MVAIMMRGIATRHASHQGGKGSKEISSAAGGTAEQTSEPQTRMTFRSATDLQ